MTEVAHSEETTRPVAMARQGRSSRLGLERLELLARWGGGGGWRGGMEEGGSSSAGFTDERVQQLHCCLRKEKRERFREGTGEGSKERRRDRGLLLASWRNSGEVQRGGPGVELDGDR